MNEIHNSRPTNPPKNKQRTYIHTYINKGSYNIKNTRHKYIDEEINNDINNELNNNTNKQITNDRTIKKSRTNEQNQTTQEIKKYRTK